jgi:hypothetical protein
MGKGIGSIMESDNLQNLFYWKKSTIKFKS